MKKSFIALGGLFLIPIILWSCSSQDNLSSTKAFNANSLSLMVEFEGEISLPKVDEQMLLKIVQWNLKEKLIRHPDNKEHRERLAKLSSLETKADALKIEAGKLHLDDPGFWIAQQMLYPIRIGGKKLQLSYDKSTLTFKPLPGMEGRYSYHMLAHINSIEDLGEKLQGMELLFPLSPLMIFEETNSFASLTDIDKTRDSSADFPCFMPDGDPVAFHNYSYYFDPYQKGCLEKYGDKLIRIHNHKVIRKDLNPVYPEYHELFDDKKLDIIIAFNEVGDRLGYRNFLSLSRQLEYGDKFQRLPGNDQNDLSLSKIVHGAEGDIAINLRMIYADGDEGVIKEKFMNGGFTNSEIIVYAGHSGYGEDLFDVFSTASEYPKAKYQIFFPFSCGSFSYAVSHILSTKAALDLDLGSYFTDILSTNEASDANYDFPLLLAFIKFFTSSAEAYGKEENISKFSYQSLLKLLDSKDHPDAKHKAVITVAGEEGNIFDPKKLNRRPENLLPDQGKLFSFLELYLSDKSKSFYDKEEMIRRIGKTYAEFLRDKASNLLLHDDIKVRTIATLTLATSGVAGIAPDLLLMNLAKIVELSPSESERKKALVALGELAKSSSLAIDELMRLTSVIDSNLFNFVLISLKESASLRSDVVAYFAEIAANKTLKDYSRTVAFEYLAKSLKEKPETLRLLSQILLDQGEKRSLSYELFGILLLKAAPSKELTDAVISYVQRYSSGDNGWESYVGEFAFLAPAPELEFFFTTLLKKSKSAGTTLELLKAVLAFALHGSDLTKTIEDLSNKNFGSGWYEEQLPIYAAEYLVKWNGSGAQKDFLIRKAFDNRIEHRGKAIVALARLGHRDTDFLAMIDQLLTSNVDELGAKSGAAAAIGILQIGGSDFLTKLQRIKETATNDANSRIWAAFSLAKMGQNPPAQISFIRDYLALEEDEDGGRAYEAREALRQLGLREQIN